MKARTILLGLSALALGLVSCQVDDVLEVNQAYAEGDAIAFKAVAAHPTRAEATTTSNLDNFTVWGWTEDGVFMNHVTAELSDGVYVTNPLYFWPEKAVDFVALSPSVTGVAADSDGTTVYIGGEISETDGDVTYTGHVAEATIDPAKGIETLTVTVPASHADQIDLCYAVELDRTSGSAVALNFRHAMSQVVFKARNTNAEAMEIDVTGVRVCSVYKTGEYTLPAVSTSQNLDDDYGTTEGIKGYQGSWTVGTAYSTTMFSAGLGLNLDEGEYVTVGEDASDLTAEGGSLFLIPQKVDAWDVDNDHHLGGFGSYFRIRCRATENGVRIWPTDDEMTANSGDEFAEIAVPVDIDWQEGYKYTYTFVFGDGLGYYPPDDPNDPEDEQGATPVLLPITFTVTVDAFQSADEVERSTKTDEESEPGDGLKPASAYSVAEALAVIAASENTEEKVYVKGVVSKVEVIKTLDVDEDTDEGHATYSISDDGETEVQLGLPNALYLGGQEFSTGEELSVGDNVIVYGYLTVDEDEVTPLLTKSVIYELNGEVYEEPEPEPEPEGLDPSWIPYHLYENGIALEGSSDGDFYVRLSDIGDDADGKTFKRLSHMTQSEWVAFVTTGAYGDDTYALAFEDEEDFWDSYYGYDAENGNMPYAIYYYEEGDDEYSPKTLFTGGDGHYRKPSNTYYLYDYDGFAWGFGTIAPETFYFDFGVTSKLEGQTKYPYDEDGAKYLFVLTLQSKDTTKHDDIHFYAFVHADDTVPETPDPLWIPFKADEGTIALDKTADGDFYVNVHDIPSDGGNPNSVTYYTILSHLTQDEFGKFVTTGEYGDSTYELGSEFDSEDAFWNAYKGGSSETAGIEYAMYYYHAGDDRTEPSKSWYSGGGEYRKPDTYVTYAAGGLSWGFCPLHTTNYFTFGVNSSLATVSGYTDAYDEDGAMYLLVMTIPAMDAEADPDINFYAFVHADTTEPALPDAPAITWEANPDFDTYTMSEDMDITLDVTAPGTIDEFTVTISSTNYLVSLLLTAIGLSANTEYSMITNETMVSLLQSVGVPCGDELYGHTKVEFALTGLAGILWDVRSIARGADINLALVVTDAYSQSASETVVLHIPTEDEEAAMQPTEKEPIYVPLPFSPIDNTSKGAPTGTDGDFYYTYEELDGTDTSRGSTEEMFEVSYSDWVTFVTTGTLNGKSYGISHATEADFWECYDGGDSNNRDYGGISDEIFYVNPTDDSLVQLKASQKAYAGYSSTWNTGGVNWNLRAVGGDASYLSSHFWMGAHSHFVATSGTNMKINGVDYSFDNVPTYDSDGKKFYVSLTINSKDPYTNPDIVLYAYVHITEPLAKKEELWIPLRIDQTSTTSGTDGEAFLYWDDIAGNTSTALGTIPTYSTMTLDEWASFISTGTYNGKDWSDDLNFTNESDFWNAYAGTTNVEGDRYTLGVWYYDANGNKVAHRVRTKECYTASPTYNINGFQFYLGAAGETFNSNTTDMHFAAGIHHLLMDDYPAVANYPVVDEYGQKYYVQITLPSKDPYTYPDINFYADVHIAMPLDPITVPLPFRVSGTGKNSYDYSSNVTGSDGDFYFTYEGINNSHTSYGSDMAVLTTITYDEWVTFVTTGELDGKDYGLSFNSEDDFWDHYKGGNTNDRGIDDEVWYVNTDNSLGQCWTSQTAYAGYSGSWNSNGIQWRLYEAGGNSEHNSDHFWVGAHYYFLEDKGSSSRITTKYADVPVYDEYGRKYCFTLTFNSKDLHTYPDLVFYAYVHITEQ